jgi:hypothetical protein
LISIIPFSACGSVPIFDQLNVTDRRELTSTVSFSQSTPFTESMKKWSFFGEGGPEECCAAALQSSINEIHRESDNFRSYLISGERHCVLEHSIFYSIESRGVSFLDWVADLADDVDVESVLCEEC